MATLFTAINTKFLAKITDDDHDAMLEADLDAILLGYLLSVIPKFTESSTDLSHNSTTTFTETLTALEIEILATMMLSEWIAPRVNHSELLETYLSPKDFTSYSPANHLKELRDLKKDLKKEADDLVTKYSYSGDLSDLS